MPDPEIELEQAYVDRAYERLEEMIEASRLFAAQAAANSASAGPLRDAIVETTLARAARLNVGDEALVFGRTDDAEGATHYIGRTAVYDTDHEQLVIDWRAPVAERFYRATPGDPLGLVRRRHLISRGPVITGIEDELLDAASEAADELVLVGEGALFDALRRVRTGRMRDIVATIQAEQDAVIRAPLERLLIVQGGPGTGKTAVALHRAAYLLYTHRRRLGRSGVLLVGPNPIFLRYIEQVLPSLGETAALATVTELVPDLAVSATEAPAVARIKGDARLARVIARSVARLPRALGQPATIPYEGKELVLSIPASRRMVELAQQRFRGRHNARRRDLEGLAVEYLWGRWSQDQREWIKTVGEETTRRHFEATVRADPRFRSSLDAMWPSLSGEGFVRRLWADERALEESAAEILSVEELDVLRRPRSDPMTDADVALVDEAAVVLGPQHRAKRDRAPAVDEEDSFMVERMLDDLEESQPLIAAQRSMFAERYAQHRLDLERDGRPAPKAPPTRFGYVIVDEAQGVTPMQWRMIARRCPSGYMTIVGDLGQSGAAYAPRSWDDVVAHLGAASSEIAELTVNYRTPAEIMDVAARVLRVAADLTPPRSIRHTGEGPVIRRVEADDLVDAAIEAARDEAARIDGGKIAVITPDSLLDDFTTRLGLEHAHTAEVLDAPIAALTVDDARGLEFDSVVVAEPAAIVRESVAGLRALYVALTRSTQRLVILHAEDLPEPLYPEPAVD